MRASLLQYRIIRQGARKHQMKRFLFSSGNHEYSGHLSKLTVLNSMFLRCGAYYYSVCEYRPMKCGVPSLSSFMPSKMSSAVILQIQTSNRALFVATHTRALFTSKIVLKQLWCRQVLPNAIIQATCVHCGNTDIGDWAPKSSVLLHTKSLLT